MRKVLVLTTLLFALLLAGCTEDNNNGSQAGNGGGDTGFNTTPGLSIKASYSGTTATFNADLYGTTLGAGYKFEWDFGDSKGKSNVANPTYNYPNEGKYTVTVNVTDNSSNVVGSAMLMVNISLSGKVINPTLDIVGNDDPLTFTFETKATSDDGVPLVYTWKFEDTEVVGGNVMTHTFSKYGATYKPLLKMENKISKDTKEKSITITTSKPNFSISCSTSGLTATCRPVIDGIPNGFADAVYTWTFGSNEAQRSTTGNNAVSYTFSGPGQKEISVNGTSDRIVGSMAANTQVSLSNQISLGSIECIETGANLLEYRCSVPVTLAETATGQQLTYEWDFGGQTPTATSGNSATYAFSKFPPLNNPSYPVSVTVGFASGSDEKASANRRIEIAHPTVSISRGTSSSSTAANFNATLSKVIAGASYRWIITGPNNFNYQVEGVDKTNTGDIELQYEGTYTANLTVSHGSFAQPITAAPLEATISADVENPTFTCTKVNGMTYTCSTGAKGYATVNGQRQEVGLTYNWTVARGDGQENYSPSTDAKFSQSSFTQTFKKYDGTYNVSLTVTPKGTNKIVAIPSQTHKTDHMSVGVSGPASVGQRKQATFDANFSGQIGSIVPTDVTYTWYVDGVAQSGSSASFTYTFNDVKVYRIKVEANASNFGSVLSAETTIDVLATNVLPEHIQNVNLACSPYDAELNGIKQKCTATINLTNAGNEAKISVGDLEAHIIPRNPRNGSSYEPVIFNSSETKDVILDWPFVDIATISDRYADRTHNAYYGIEVYHKSSGKRIIVFNDEWIAVKIPKVSYELEHTANDAYNIVGTGAKIRLKSAQDPYNSDPQMSWTWQVHFKGLAGDAYTSFGIGVGGEKDFKQQMINARFAGKVNGNAFNWQSGFGLKLEGPRISRPLYLYGTNTQQGLRELPNAVGNFLGLGVLFPEGTMMWEGFAVRDPGSHGFLASFVVRVDPAYKTYGWDLYCVIGAIGKRNSKQWEYSLPEAETLVGHPTQTDRFSAMIGAYGSLEEKRDKYVAQNGQPKLPAAVWDKTLGFELPGYWFNMAEWGLRGVNVGYMSTPGNLEGCLELKRYDYNQANTGGWYSEDVYYPYQ